MGVLRCPSTSCTRLTHGAGSQQGSKELKGTKKGVFRSARLTNAPLYALAVSENAYLLCQVFQRSEFSSDLENHAAPSSRELDLRAQFKHRIVRQTCELQMSHKGEGQG